MSIDPSVFLRCLGFMVAMPIGFSFVTLGFRVIVAVLLSFSLDSLNLHSQNFEITEIILGYAIGLPLSLIVSLGNSFGSLFDSARGQTISNLYDSQTHAVSSVCALMFEKVVQLFVMCSGVLNQALLTLKNSFVLTPGAITDNFVSIGSKITQLIILELSQLFLLFLPFAAIFIVLEIAGGVLTKLIPRFSFIGEVFQLKSLLGFSCLILFLRYGHIDSMIGPVEVYFRTIALGNAGG